MGIPVYARINPLRRPKGFEPVVQRWSVAVPAKYDAYIVAFYGVQGPHVEALMASPFFAWLKQAFAQVDGPTVHDHARYLDEGGEVVHVVAAYWVDPAKFAAWRSARKVADWWNDPVRVTESCGYFREELYVPLDRQETLYWQDYPAGLSRSPDVAIYPTPYCGYYGAMRDRIPVAAVDALEKTIGSVLSEPVERDTRGAHWRVHTPHNLAVIRSAAAWGQCDEEQHADFMQNLRGPLERGMQYLRGNPVATGCCTLRYQQTCDADGLPQPEAHALGYFLSLADLENWAERHSSHHAIFSSAMARYKKYGPLNQLRTWHEVYVVPEQNQQFDYFNCKPMTGLLPWFKAVRLA